MKRNLFVLTAIIAVTSMLSSCKKEYLIDVNGNLSGKVYDQYHNPLEKALITVEGTELKDSTDAEGSYVIKGISLGSYSVSISKEGYKTQRGMISVNAEYSDGISSKKQSYDVAVTMDGKLYALSGKAKGYIVYSGTGRPVANARVVAYWSYRDMNNYTTETFQTTTDAEGLYNFTGLPLIDYTNDYYSGNSLTIAAYDPQNVASSGSATVSNTGVARSIQINIYDNDLNLISYTGSNNNKVDTLLANAKITLTFNQNVSEEITKKMNGYVDLYNENVYDKVAATVTYSDNKVTITPLTNFRPGTRYSVSFRVYATEYKSYNSSFYFNTILTPAKAMTVRPVLTINTVSTSNYLKLTTVTPNASGYDIYASQDGGKTDYLLITSDSYNLTSTNGYYLGGYPAGSKFYVVPYNYDSNWNRTYGTASAIVTKP